MAIFYVHIPCYVSKDHPEGARTPDKFCAVAVDADSPKKAIEKVTSALVSLVQSAPEPRSMEPE